MTVPILNASGCLDALTAPEVALALDAFVTKTITPQPREGNPPVRIAETEAGMLNSIGLQGPGIDGLLGQTLPALSALGLRVWVSVGGFSVDDYAGICERLDERADVEVIELNLSCPNVEEAPESVGRRSSPAAARARPSRSTRSSRRRRGTSASPRRRSWRQVRTGSRSSTRSGGWRSTRARCSRSSAGEPVATPVRRSGRSLSRASRRAPARSTYRSSGWGA